MSNIKRIDTLKKEHFLPEEELALLLETALEEDRSYAAGVARTAADEVFGKKIYFRALVEISNYCRNNCYYCGVRRDNNNILRYRLKEEDILCACSEAYSLGLRTFVLQGGEDAYYTDEKLCKLINRIKTKYPDCALTLSLGERSKKSYQLLFDAGADRYLLRHETADCMHYSRLHPEEMSFANRVRCLENLREIGFQTGCGFMVGSPYQTTKTVVKDLMYIKAFNPQMVGIGPFIPHKATPLRDFKAGSADDTVFLLSIIRLLVPHAMLPATTALGTIAQGGRERGILAGANVLMPNVSPYDARSNYKIYENKLGSEDKSSDSVETAKKLVESIGYEVHEGRGDYF